MIIDVSRREQIVRQVLDEIAAHRTTTPVILGIRFAEFNGKTFPTLAMPKYRLTADHKLILAGLHKINWF